MVGLRGATPAIQHNTTSLDSPGIPPYLILRYIFQHRHCQTQPDRGHGHTHHAGVHSDRGDHPPRQRGGCHRHAEQGEAEGGEDGL